MRLLKLDNAISQKVLFEIEQIDQLIHDSGPLFDLCRIKDPDFIERCGIALILHSFYIWNRKYNAINNKK